MKRLQYKLEELKTSIKHFENLVDMEENFSPKVREQAIYWLDRSKDYADLSRKYLEVVRGPLA